MQLEETFKKVKRASKSLALLSDQQRNKILLAVADAIIDQQERILTANTGDLAKMDAKNPLYDRLQLTHKRLSDIAGDMRNVANLPSPLGHVTKEKTLPNGLRLHRVSVPFGVIGMIYEARPNVTYDVFSLCFKSGNACVLKGGSDADLSNQASVELIHEVLERFGVNPDVVTLLPATHEATGEMLNAVGYIDLCIPRGGRRLIDFVRDTARIPVIETGAGVVHCYIDQDADLQMAARIVQNAKCRRVSVCNALDCLLVHRSVEPHLDQILSPVKDRVCIHYGEYGREWLSYNMSVKIVDSIDEAIQYINTYGSGHSEAIVTDNQDAAARFLREVDAACVYHNAPTSFTDGAQFGLGSEIGISTQKLHARGPMALQEITTYKWIIKGAGQIRC